MKAEIITIGTEILIGDITNTNGPFVSKLLTEKGFEVEYHTSIRDNRADMLDAFHRAFDRSDVIFICGGLGPTNDDITREVTAEALGLKVVKSDEAYQMLKEHFEANGYTFSESNLRQANVIEGSKVIKNHHGTAPGLFLSINGKYIFLVPGPPSEFRPMVKEIINKYLPVQESEILSHSLYVMLLGESNVERKIRELFLENDHIDINTFAKSGEVEIKIIATSHSLEDRDHVHEEMNEVIKVLKSEFGSYIYSEGKDTLMAKLIYELRKRNETVSFAESITGGLLAHRLIEVPNSSKVFESGFITYSNEAKMKTLNVSKEVLDTYGAVSSQCAGEMSRGLYEHTKSTYALATTGEAGPVTSEDKPVGLVYFSICKDGIEIANEELHLSGSRKEIQSRAATKAISTLLYKILGG